MLTGRNMLKASFIVGTCIFMLFLIMYNCGMDENELNPPGGDGGDQEYDVTILINPGAIPADGQSTAKVQVIVTSKKTGAPVVDEYVYLNISAGEVDPSRTLTDENGEAFTTIIADVYPGTATLRAWVGSSIGERNVTFTGEGITFDIRASERIICGDGTASTHIIAELKASGAAVVGQQIQFTAECGCLNDSTGSVTIFTGEDGRASVYLRAPLVDQYVGGLSCVVTALWRPSDPFSGSSIGVSTTVGITAVEFVCWFEDLNGKVIDEVDRDNGQICLAVASIRCKGVPGGKPGVDVRFTSEKGAFLNDGVFTESITIPTDDSGRASAELRSGVCETGSGSTTVTAEVAGSMDVFCGRGEMPITSCLIDFVGTVGDADPLCLEIDLDYSDQSCRDDPRRTYIALQAHVTNKLTGNSVDGVYVRFSMLSDGGLTLTPSDCRPIPPPQCDNTEIVTVTTNGGYALAYGYVCTYGTAELKVMAMTLGTYGAIDTITASGIGLQEGL